MMAKAINSEIKQMKVNSSIFLFLLLMSFNTTIAQKLEDLRWKKRVLVVKSSEPNNAIFSNQLKAFERDKKGMIERKLVIYSIQQESIRFIDFRSSPQHVDYDSLKESTKTLFENNTPFEIILIGLDGDTKLKQHQFLKLSDLYTLIDGMPMRRAELRDKN